MYIINLCKISFRPKFTPLLIAQFKKSMVSKSKKVGPQVIFQADHTCILPSHGNSGENIKNQSGIYSVLSEKSLED